MGLDVYRFFVFDFRFSLVRLFISQMYCSLWEPLEVFEGCQTRIPG